MYYINKAYILASSQYLDNNRTRTDLCLVFSSMYISHNRHYISHMYVYIIIAIIIIVNIIIIIIVIIIIVIIIIVIIILRSEPSHPW